MRGIAVLGALLLSGIGAGLAMPQAASAKSEEWLRRDREIIRQMNLRELAKVRRRDAQYAARAQASRSDRDDYARRRAAYQEDMADYYRQQRQYRVRHAAWREAVSACNAGVRSACAR